jgi:hypothetical protein
VTKRLSTDAKSTLAALACETDVLWTPFRTTSPKHAPRDAAIIERRNLFRSSGLLFITGGAGADRMRGSRSLTELLDRRFVVLGGYGRNRTAKLTPAGDNYARSFLPSHRIDESWLVLEQIAATENAFDGRSNAGFVREFEVLGIEDAELSPVYNLMLVELEDRALPLLAAGLIESCSDAEGTLGYRTTDAGREMLAAGQPSTPSKMPVYDKSLGTWFTGVYCQTLAEREQWKPSQTNHVWIPLSAGLWPARDDAELQPA